MPRWIARVQRSDEPGRRFNFVGYRRDDPSHEFLYVRDVDGTWKDEANGEVADHALSETFEYLCVRAEERRADELRGVYSDDGPGLLEM